MLDHSHFKEAIVEMGRNVFGFHATCLDVSALFVGSEEGMLTW